MQSQLEHHLMNLPEHLRAFLHTLTIFEDGWTCEAATLVCNAPSADQWCEELSEKHLLSRDTLRPGGGYRLVNWVREQLKKFVDPIQFQKLQHYHKTYFFRLVCEAAPNLRYTPHEFWMQRLETEKANLYAAFSVTRGEESIQFALAVWRWAYVSAHIKEICRMLHIARFSVKSFPKELLPELYRALGSIYYRENEIGIAKGYLEESHQEACAQQNWEEAAFAAQLICIMMGKTSDMLGASEWIETSLNYWIRAGSVWGQAAAYNEKAVLAAKDERLDEANHFYSESEKLFEQINDKHQASKILNNRGLLAERQKQYEVAENFHRKCLLYRKDILDKRFECETLNNLAAVCFKQQKFKQSNAHFCKALVLMEEIGYTAAIPCALTGLGQSAHKQGKEKFATMCFGLADKLNPDHMHGYSASERQELNDIIVELRLSLRPQLYGRLYKKGQKLTIKPLLSNLFD